MNVLKNLFLITVLFSMSGLFLTSCNLSEELNPTSNEINNIPEFANGRAIALPVGYEAEDAMIAYLENITEEQVTKLEANHKTASYLLEIGKFAEVKSTMKDGMHYSDVDLQSVLSPAQQVELERYIPSTDAGNERWCSTSTGWCYIRTCCGSTTDVYCWITWGIC